MRDMQCGTGPMEGDAASDDAGQRTPPSRRATRIASILQSRHMLMPGASALTLVAPEHEALEGLTDGLDVDFNEALTAYVAVCEDTQARHLKYDLSHTILSTTPAQSLRPSARGETDWAKKRIQLLCPAQCDEASTQVWQRHSRVSISLTVTKIEHHLASPTPPNLAPSTHTPVRHLSGNNFSQDALFPPSSCQAPFSEALMDLVALYRMTQPSSPPPVGMHPVTVRLPWSLKQASLLSV